jgi:hypothetical protein
MMSGFGVHVQKFEEILNFSEKTDARCISGEFNKFLKHFSKL